MIWPSLDNVDASFTLLLKCCIGFKVIKLSFS